jgi:hypothetical protein
MCYESQTTFIHRETTSDNQQIMYKTLQREINLARNIQTLLLHGKFLHLRVGN